MYTYHAFVENTLDKKGFFLKRFIVFQLFVFLVRNVLVTYILQAAYAVLYMSVDRKHLCRRGIF